MYAFTLKTMSVRERQRRKRFKKCAFQEKEALVMTGTYPMQVKR